MHRLIERIRQVGQRLCTAQPREWVVGNIVRRLLGLIREEAEDDRDKDASNYSDAGESHTSSPHRNGIDDTLAPRRAFLPSNSILSPFGRGDSVDTNMEIGSSDTDDSSPRKGTPDIMSRRPPLLTSHTSYAPTTPAPMVTSMFNLFSEAGTPSGLSSPTPTGANSPTHRTALTTQHLAGLNTPPVRNIKSDVVEGIKEIIDEIKQAHDQVAGYALEHIHDNERILTSTASHTVLEFLLKAAKERKFTVIYAESYHSDHFTATSAKTEPFTEPRDDSKSSSDENSLSTATFAKSLTAAGITVIIIPDSSVFALMSRVDKVIIGTHVVLANGGLVAAAGARIIASAAKKHARKVFVVSGVYKLSPVYPFDVESLIEYGGAGQVEKYEEGGDMMDAEEVENPLFDYVSAELVDLYITNL